MVAPFVAIYIFNWTVFVIIFVSLLRKIMSKRMKEVKKDSQDSRKKLYKQFNIAVALSVLFGLGWGIGLAATQQSFTNVVVPDILSALFVCLTAFHGLFIFIMYCLQNDKVRNLWKVWFNKAVGKKRSKDIRMSTFKKHQRESDITIGTRSTSLPLFVTKQESSIILSIPPIISEDISITDISQPGYFTSSFR